MSGNHLIREMTWSFSRISSFHDCPYGFYLKYILLEEPQRQFFASYGSFMHSILEMYLSGKLRREELADHYITHFFTSVRQNAPSQKILSHYFLDGLSYLQNAKLDFQQVQCVEKEFHFTIGGYPFIGFADLISKNQQDQLILTDHKAKAIKPPKRVSSKPPAGVQDILRQMYLYSIPIQQSFGRYPDLLAINCYRTQQVLSFPFQLQDLENAKKWAVSSIEQILATESWPPNIEPFRCRHICDVNRHCEYYQLSKG